MAVILATTTRLVVVGLVSEQTDLERNSIWVYRSMGREILCVDEFSSAALIVCVTARFPLIHKLDLRCFSSADSNSISMTLFRKA